MKRISIISTIASIVLSSCVLIACTATDLDSTQVNLNNVACNTDTDCQPGERCLEETPNSGGDRVCTFVPPPQEPVTCTSDADCSDGQLCEPPINHGPNDPRMCVDRPANQCGAYADQQTCTADPACAWIEQEANGGQTAWCAAANS